MAVIENSMPNTLISGTAEADSISSDSYNVTINTADGNDYIRNYSYSANFKIYIYDETDDELIVKDIEFDPEFNPIEISTGSGDDTIENHGSKVSINGGADNDLIKNGYNGGTAIIIIDDAPYYPYEDVTIDGGAGDDTIYSRSQNVIIRGGSGNDSIIGSGYICKLQPD